MEEKDEERNKEDCGKEQTWCVCVCVLAINGDTLVNWQLDNCFLTTSQLVVRSIIKKWCVSLIAYKTVEKKNHLHTDVSSVETYLIYVSVFPQASV